MTEDTQNLPEENVDQLLEQVEAESQKSDVIQDQAQVEAQAEAVKRIEEYEIETAPGKTIRAPIEKILGWAKHGYGASNKITEFQKQLDSYKQKEAQYKEWDEKYGAVDTYVRQNPKFWEHVQSEWQRANQAQQAINPELAGLINKVNSLEQVAQTYEQREAQRLQEQQTAAYMEELAGVKKQYPQIDFDSPDENGKSLEYKVLEYARDNGISKFTTAFRDVHFDELAKLEAQKAKEKVIADKQSKTKLGILSTSNVPTTRKSDSIKGKSYNDLAKEVMQEMNLA